MEGVHSIDISMIVAPVLHEYIMSAAKIQGVRLKKRPTTKDEELSAKRKATLAASIERTAKSSQRHG